MFLQFDFDSDSNKDSQVMLYVKHHWGRDSNPYLINQQQ